MALIFTLASLFAGSTVIGAQVGPFGNPAGYELPKEPAAALVVVLHEDDIFSDLLAPSIVIDDVGDQGVGPTYGDCLVTGVTGSSTSFMIVGQRINGSFPTSPPGDIACWSWRFDTDENPNTGYQQYWYIGIDWEILIMPSGNTWTVNKWSLDTGYVNIPDARIILRQSSQGDVIAVLFDADEIGAPVDSNWITWNGYYPTWEDLAPNSSVAYWHE